MAKKLTLPTILILLISIITVLTVPAVAANKTGLTGLLEDTGTNAGWEVKKIDSSTGFSALLGSITRTVLSFLGVVFMIYTIYGGWMWLTAAGNEEKVGKAKKIIIEGFIGLVVTLSAAAIYFLVAASIAGVYSNPNN